MPRLPLTRTRALRLTAVALVLGIALPAAAQTGSAEPAQPVIDRHPDTIGYRSDARIKGHLENGTPGDEVTLQKRRPGGSWFDVATKPIDDQNEVRFRDRDLNRTKLFRFVHIDEVTSAKTKSAAVKVKVKPKLTMRLEPGHVMEGNRTRVKGRLLPRRGKRDLVLLRKANGSWGVVKRITTARDGRYSTSIRGRKPSRRKVKIAFPGDVDNVEKAKKRTLKVYEPALATWYGPGLYGNGTACGQTLHPDTFGVAHRTLPCGTKVSITYNGRAITVPVIDRGPYSDADWDLTQATAERLGFSGTGTIGVLIR